MLRGLGRIALGLGFALYGAYTFVRGAVPLAVDTFLSQKYVADKEYSQFMAVAVVILSAFFLLAGVQLIRKGLAARRPTQQGKDAGTPT